MVFLFISTVMSNIVIGINLNNAENSVKSTFDADIIIPDDFPTIQEGIDNANPGDTIFVRSGIYYESIKINKENLVIQGENKYYTVIDKENLGNDAVFIEADNVIFKGFTVANARCKNRIIWNQSGIEIVSSNVTIQDNIIIDNRLGILSHTIAFNLTIKDNFFFSDGLLPGCPVTHSDHIPMESLNNTVINNTVNGKPILYIQNQKDKTVSEDAGQVILINCTNVTVKNLYLKNVDFSVMLFHSSNCTVENTTIVDSDGELILFFSENNTIQNNTITNAFHGVCLDIGSINNIVRYNEIRDSLFGISILTSCFGNKIYGNRIFNSDCGLVISSYLQNMPSHDNIVNNNVFSNNIIGIKITTTFKDPLCYTYDNVISNNTLFKNKQGIYIISSEGNVIKNNIFKRNLIPALFKGCKKNYWYHNYWNRPRILPKPIFGTRKIGIIGIPWVNFDINPIKRFQ